MTIIGLVVILCLVGIGLYCINSIIPMDPTIKRIINIVAVVLVVLWLLEVFGLIGPWGADCNGRVPQVSHTR